MMSRVWMMFLMLLSISGCAMMPHKSDDSPDSDQLSLATIYHQENPRDDKTISSEGEITHINDQGMVTYDLDQHPHLQGLIPEVEPHTTQTFKQASLFIQGGKRIRQDITDELVDRIHVMHVSMEKDGDDFVLTPDFSQSQENTDEFQGSSYIVIEPGVSSFRLRTDTSWWSDDFFVIPSNEYTILQINRTPTYRHGQISYDGHIIEDIYMDMYGSHHKNISIIKGAMLDFKLLQNDAIPLERDQIADIAVYHMEFDQGAQSDIDCSDIVNESLDSTYTLKEYLTEQDLHITSCKKLRPDRHGVRSLKAKNTYRQGLVVLAPGSTTILSLHHDAYAATFSAHVPKKDDDFFDSYYGIAFDSLFHLDDEKILEQCRQVRPDCKRRYDGSFEIQPVPGVAYQDTRSIPNIYGQTVDVSREYAIDDLVPAVTVQEIVSNTSINILPHGGDFSDLLTQYRNVQSFDIDIQACEVGQTFITDQGYKGKGAENYMFDCQGPIHTVTVQPSLGSGEVFEYRKTYRTAVSIPDVFDDAQAFSLSFVDQNGDEHHHYVAYSDIAIRSKLANNSLYLWAQDYQKGQEVTGTYTIRTADGMIIDQGDMTSGGPTIIPIPSGEFDEIKQLLLVTVTDGEGNEGWVIAHRDGQGFIDMHNTSIGDYRGLMIDSYVDGYDVTDSKQNIRFFGEILPNTIYGYTSRGMYKPGDTIHFAGYMRDMSPEKNQKTSLKNQNIIITLQSLYDHASSQSITVQTDDFGGFTGSIDLSDDVVLGSYRVLYKTDGQPRHGYGRHDHVIEIQEYTKPTFSPGLTWEDNHGLSVSVDPKYFFGEQLPSYDVQLQRSLVEEYDCMYCRWEPTNRYENIILGEKVFTGGSMVVTDIQGSRTHTIIDNQALHSLLPGGQLKITATVRDGVTGEVQYQYVYYQPNQDRAIELEGRLYDWLYRDGGGEDPRQTTMIDGTLRDEDEMVDRLMYEIYYRSYDMDTQQGVDGNLYYVREQPHIRIDEGEITLSDDGTFSLPVRFIDKPGSYIISFKGYHNKKLIVQNDKVIEWYFRDDGRDLLGTIPNNYTLSVSPSQPHYSIDDGFIELDIVPYPRGSQAIITIEQGQYILKTIQTTLDGSVLRIPIDESYIPSIVISVMVLQPTELSDHSRAEPRFYAGYATVDIDTESKNLQIQVTSDQSVYQPGEEVTLTVQTKDYLDRPVDARVSLAVVDKSLTYLYDRAKDPLSVFFYKIGTSVKSFTNMKLLYQSLKVFATDGSKGGSGVGGKTMFQYIRDSIVDEAYRNPAIYTKNGTATVTFTLPDNMTTWLVDAVGITSDTKLGTTSDTKLGTTSAEIMTQKDVIIEGYVPRFLSLGDEIITPYKIILTDKQEGGSLSGHVWITDPTGTLTHEIMTRNHNDSIDHIDIPLSIPEEWRELGSVLVHHEVWYGDQHDHIVQEIPLRTSGQIIHQSKYLREKKGSLGFDLPETKTSQLSLHASSMPTDVILPSIHDDLWSDDVRYAGSAIQQLAALDDLLRRTAVSDTKLDRYENGKVRIDGQWYDIHERIDTLIHFIGSLQNTHGGIKASPKSSGSREDMYQRTLMTYSTLLTLHANESSSQLNDIIAKAEKYLSAHHADYPEARQLAVVTSMMYDGGLTDESDREVSESGYDAIIAYVRSSIEQKATKIDRQLAIVPTNGKDASGYGYGTTALSTALLTQAIYHDQGIVEDYTNQLQSLIALLAESESYSYAGLTSLYARQAIIDARERISTGSSSCEYEIGSKKYTTDITKDAPLAIILPDETDTIQWSCTHPVLRQLTASYLPEQTGDIIKPLSPHLSLLSQTISHQKNHYESMVSRATDTAGLEVTASIHLPATLIHAPVKQLIPLIKYSDNHCRPDHIAVRYDRIDLFYDVLEPGTCDITYPIHQGYAGVSTTMPVQISEASRGMIWGSSVVVSH